MNGNGEDRVESESRASNAAPGQRPGPRHTAQSALPGEPGRKGLLEQIVRVDHAGEYGARRIYEGQLAVLGKRPCAPTIQHMLEQELVHLHTFEQELVKRRTRPSVLIPLWHVAGFALGAATALMSEKAAMACTVAVEEVIDGHYARQAEKLGEDEAELRETIIQYQAEEVEHRNIGLEHGAEQATAYPLLSAVIKAGCHAAIWVSARV